jgi:uncharacterized phage protein (TIGR01671 family)
MREIKFRCWFANKMWYAIPAIRFDKDGVRVIDLNHDENDFSLSPDTWTGNDDYVLMQFTGLKDKADKEIYEGDIIRVKHCEHIETIAIGDDGYKEIFRDVIGEVVYGDAAFHFTGHSMGEIPLYAYDDYEVIGNIYENPALVLTS